MLDPSELASGVAAGDRRSLARSISIIEDRRDGHHELITRLYPEGSETPILGITGAPGAGKSTLVDGLVSLLRDRGLQVAVLAVDPSSPFTGGALLGDRVRMQSHASDPGVFIRSMSSRGHLGGLADATSRVLVALDAAGFDLLIVETVGVGQSEVEIVETADTTAVLLAPGWGDGIQAAKAGILEIGDVLVVNKADLPGADSVVAELKQMISLGPDRDWTPRIVKCSASKGDGIDRVWEAIEAHRRFLEESGEAVEKRKARATLQVRRAVAARLHAQVDRDGIKPDVLDRVLDRDLDPWSAARFVVP